MREEDKMEKEERRNKGRGELREESLRQGGVEKTREEDRGRTVRYKKAMRTDGAR